MVTRGIPGQHGDDTVFWIGISLARHDFGEKSFLAVRQGDHIYISGTTGTNGDRVIGGNSPAAQMSFVVDKIEGALQAFGAGLQNVVRTRVLVRNIGDWEAVARIHGERFRNIQPANTLVQAELVGDEYLVEMEAEAVLSQTERKGE